MKIKELIRFGVNELNTKKIDESNLKVRLLLSHILGEKKEYLIIHSEDEVNKIYVDSFIKGIDYLKKSMPIQYITNSVEFMGLDFYVDKNVLIPRPDTEILVEEVIDLVKQIKESLKRKIRILDLCTGSGAIAISLTRLLKDNVIITCSDISLKALEVVKINAEKNDVNIKILNSNMFNNIEEKYDIIVSNPPYIESNVLDTLSNEVKNEPIIALDGGIDGLDYYRIIAINAKKYLYSNGYIALEIGYNQKDKVINLLKEHNYKNIYSKKDLGGNDRIVVASLY